MDDTNSMNMNIMYIHGFGSKWKPNSDKVTAIKTLGNVTGINISYDLPFEQVYQKYRKHILDHSIDLIVGTSLGGFWSGYMGNKFGIPFVSINPTINPQESLRKYQGNNTDHYGNQYNLTSSVINQYQSFPQQGAGLILLDLNDQVLNANQTKLTLDPFFRVITFQGGDHRFQHISESIPKIKVFYRQAEVAYGF